MGFLPGLHLVHRGDANSWVVHVMFLRVRFVLEGSDPSGGRFYGYPRPPLSWNRLHVFANHLVISGLPVAHVGHGDENVAGETERELGLVRETNIDAKRSVVDGMTDVIHNLALDAGIQPSRRGGDSSLFSLPML